MGHCAVGCGFFCHRLAIIAENVGGAVRLQRVDRNVTGAGDQNRLVSKAYPTHILVFGGGVVFGVGDLHLVTGQKLQRHGLFLHETGDGVLLYRIQLDDQLIEAWFAGNSVIQRQLAVVFGGDIQVGGGVVRTVGGIIGVIDRPEGVGGRETQGQRIDRHLSCASDTVAESGLFLVGGVAATGASLVGLPADFGTVGGFGCVGDGVMSQRRDGFRLGNGIGVGIVVAAVDRGVVKSVVGLDTGCGAGGIGLIALQEVHGHGAVVAGDIAGLGQRQPFGLRAEIVHICQRCTTDKGGVARVAAATEGGQRTGEQKVVQLNAIVEGIQSQILEGLRKADSGDMPQIFKGIGGDERDAILHDDVLDL